MKNLLVSPQRLCKDIDKAIKLDKEFMYNVDAKVASLSLILPPAEKTNKKTKWGKINTCSKIYKELKDLKKATVALKMSCKDGEFNAYEESRFNLACTNFALKFKEIAKSVILNKVVEDKAQREFWNELLNLLDKIGYQLTEDCEIFASLGRMELAFKKKKERESQRDLDTLNRKMTELQQQQKELEEEIEYVEEVESINSVDKVDINREKMPVYIDREK